MGVNDSLTVTLRSDNKWHETARMSRTGSTGNSLSSLSDVTLVAPVLNDEHLIYDSALTQWTNGEVVIPPGSPQGPNDGNLAPTNTSLGVDAMNANTGVTNTAVGNEAMGGTTAGDNNTALGAEAGRDNGLTTHAPWSSGTSYSVGDYATDSAVPPNIWRAESSGVSGSTEPTGLVFFTGTGCQPASRPKSSRKEYRWQLVRKKECWSSSFWNNSSYSV